MSETEPIVLDHASWTQHELLMHIIQRYFDLGNEAMAGQAWEARAKGGRSDSAAIADLNNQLFALGYLAMLDEGDPAILSIAPHPEDQPIIPNWQMGVVWAMMAGFLTLIGTAWLTQYHPDAMAFDGDLLRQAALQMAFPMLLILALASEGRRRMAAYFGVDIGHVVPIAFPILSASWPFGLAGVLSQRRADLTPIPNRRALAMIEFTTPLILFLGGTVLTLVGLHLTPVEPPNLTSAPIAFQNNPLITILSLDWLGETLWIRLQWIHLTGLAGIGLTLVGWTLLLPIPGLPGDRLLHAIFGPAQMSDSNRQTSIFVAMLAAMVIIFSETEYMPWLIIAVLGAMRRFSPETTPAPLIINEALVPSAEERSRYAALLVFVLVAGFPGMYPSYNIPDWDGALDTTDWADELHLNLSNSHDLTLDLAPAGMAPVSGWLQLRLEGENSVAWEITSPQFNTDGYHRFDGVTQHSPSTLSATITPPNVALDNPSMTPDTAMWLRILIDVEGHIEEHLITLLPAEVTSPIDPLWLLIEDTDTPRICVSVDKVDDRPAHLSLTNPFWEFEAVNEGETEGETAGGTDGAERETAAEKNLTESGLHDICLRGYPGALQSSFATDEYQRVMGPTLTLDFEDGEQIIWSMPVNGTEARLQISESQWHLPYWMSETSSYTISFGAEGSAFCPSSQIHPEMDVSAAWNWTFHERSTILIPAGVLSDGTLHFESEGWLAFCQEGALVRSYQVVEGDDVLVMPGELERGLQTSQNVIVNRENHSLYVRVEWSGDAPDSDVWDVSIPDVVEADSEVSIDVQSSGDLSLYRAVWITASDGDITVHLAARCPVDGCEVS